MTQRAYKSGSSFPERKEGTLRLYSSRNCPYAERPRLVLAHKAISHEVVNINLQDKPEWFMAKSPMGKVPVLELEDGRILYESTAVSEYLDDAYPGDKLQAKDPLQKAKDRILLECFGQIASLHYGITVPVEHKNKMSETRKIEIQTKIDLLNKCFKFYDDELVQRGSQFFAGSQPGMIDFFMWPHMERIPSLMNREPGVTMTESFCPRLVSWWKAMAEVPAIKKEMEDTEWHDQVYQLKLQGKPHFDHGLNE